MPTPPPERETPADSRATQNDGAPAAASSQEAPAATVSARTFRPLLPTEKATEPAHPGSWVRLGQRFNDFEILRELGTGAFSTVFLARQLSLDRQVALKVSANCGSEARTLASLEHDHIVCVFSESVDPAAGVRLLCMQYVPGTTLAQVIRALGRRERATWSGQALLEAIDTLSTHPAAFDPAAFRDREQLGLCDFGEAVCWIGSRLALALAHAHSQGVLHRDVKPANILLNPYGRPMLADFNVAFSARQLQGPTGEFFGGTVAYMAPEHLDAFNPDEALAADAVDARSDVYSLGLVLFELLTGHPPFQRLPQPGERLQDTLRAMAAERRAGAPVVPAIADAGAVLQRVIRRCLQPDPERRYQTATDLAHALEGCRELRRAEREMPSGGLLTRAVARHPVVWMGVLALLPHFVASVVNISYNALRIVLSPEQQVAFGRITLVYNAITYPFCVWLLYLLLVPVYRAWRAAGRQEQDAAEMAALRRRILRLPGWTALLSLVGWLPGALLFPLLIHQFAGPLSPEIFGHFLVSFAIAGLIALTYSVVAVQFVVLQVLYPRFWGDSPAPRHQAALELRAVDRRLRILQLLAGLIPLAGAILLIGVGPEEFTATSYRDFRLLLAALITLGMAGFAVTLFAGNLLGKTVNAFVRREGAHQGDSGSHRGPTR